MNVGENAPPDAAPDAGRRWTFGAAQFDEATLELCVGGTVIALERKVLEVLRQLLYRAGEVVTKDELLDAVWPGRILADTSVAKCISKLRAAIGGEDQSVIKTVHGYGYRFVAAVVVDSPHTHAPAPRLSLKAGDHPPQRAQWSLVERLGGGGQGEVWLVQHDKTREQRVYKFALDLDGLSIVKREITLSRYLHDTLGEREDFVRALDWNLGEPPFYLELEHVGGGNLEHWVEDHGGFANVSLAVRLEVIARIADTLAAAHSVGVLHKDLKPANVLVVDQGDAAPRIKLTDFGSGGIDPQRLADAGITRLGFTTEISGTPMYLAPEVMSGQPGTVQADVYALGVMLYQMAVGDFKRALASGWELDIADALLREDIALAVAGDPARRLGDVAQLATRLRSIDERREHLATEQAQRVQLEQERLATQERARSAELAVARLRARRGGLLIALSTLIVGLAIIVSLYLEARRARTEATAAAATSQAVADFLSKDLFAVVGEKPLRDFTVQELLEAASVNLAKREQAMPEAAAQIHAALGNAFYTIEQMDDAVKHLDVALLGLERQESMGSEASLAVAARLLLAMSATRSILEGLPRFESVLELARSHLPADHPQVEAFAQQLAWARFQIGDWRRAASELEDLVRSRNKRGLVNDQALGTLEMQLGRVHTHLGDFKKGADLLRDSIARLERALGHSHLMVAGAHALLAEALIEVEQVDDAARELDRAEEITRPWVVDDRSSPLTSIHFLRGFLRLREGRSLDAVRILESTLSATSTKDWIRKADFTFEFRAWLALAYRDLGDLARARATLRESLEIGEQVVGARHPVVQDIRIALADIERLTAGAGPARAVLDTVDLLVLQDLGRDHPLLAHFLRVKGLVELDEGKSENARKSLDDARRIFEARYGAAHRFSRRAREELARASTREPGDSSRNWSPAP